MSTGSRLLLASTALSLSVHAQFTLGPSNPIIGNPCCVASGDFNGDGKPDVAVLNTSSGTVSILLGNGSGAFKAGPGGPVPAGSSPAVIALGDFNGDGKLDVAVGGAGGITVLIGNGLGGFTATPVATSLSSGFGSLAVSDFNGDGKLDLAAASANFGGTNSILLGNGSGGFTVAPGSPFLEETYPFALVVGDFNGDGKLDVAIAMAAGRNVTILLGDGTGRVVSSSVIPLPSIPSDIQAGDFNRDGKLDLAVAVGRSVVILLNDGSGGFTAAPGAPVSSGAVAHSLAIADFNGDGKLDIAVADKTSGLTVLLGDGSAGFTEAPGSPFATGTFPYTVAVGDFNLDGKPDLVIASGITSNVTALLNGYPGYVCTNTTPPVITSIVSASAYGGYSYFASGSWLEIKGTNLADPSDPRLKSAANPGQWTSSDFNAANAPTLLDGIGVSINGKPAYIWYLSTGQLNVQAPEDIASGNVDITATNCKATSPTFTITRKSLAPGFLAPANYAVSGTPYMAAFFASDGAYVLSAAAAAMLGVNGRPAQPGDRIYTYGVGFGDVTPSILPGVIAQKATLVTLVNKVAISFGTAPATILYQGLTPGLVGLYQFNFTVPSSLPSGDYQINATQNGAPVPQTMYLTVQN